MCTYLSKRGATYYFRRSIPVDLSSAFGGKSAFMVSLRTKDREAAKRLIPAHTIDSDKLLADARSESGPSPAASPTFSPWLTEFAMDQSRLADQDEAERQSRWEARAPIRERLERALKLGSQQISPEEAAMRDILRDQREAFTVAEERQIMRRIAKAEADRDIQPPARTPSDARQAAEVIAVADVPGVMLDGAIIDLWAAERKVVRKGKDTHRAVAEWFYQRVGRKVVGDITRKDVLAFKQALVAEGQTPANIKIKLSRLRTLLQWSADNDYAETNVAAGITILDTDAAKNKRREFDLNSLNAIFASPVFTMGDRPKQGRGEAAYWLPLLALYTGARLEELGQLRPSDVQQITYPDADGVNCSSWFVRIKEDTDGDLRLKNAASERDVPVHAELERLGFVEFVIAANDQQRERLFDGLVPNIYGRLTAKWGEWFGPYLRKICGVTDRRLVFHSFRHTFKQYARSASIVEGVQRQIMGHSSSDAADAYGSGYPLHQIVDGMKLYRVPGLTPIAAAAGARAT